MKPLTLCKFVTPKLKNAWSEYPFSKHDRFIYMGDIVQMEGHCVVVNVKTGQNYCCYHTDDFVPLSDDEL